MTEQDRAAALCDLDRRHDELLDELETLNEQIERALAAFRPAAAPEAAPAVITATLRRAKRR
jgi:hypothetical protein